jgi:glyoxylase-like metal-dependent hydrolase (beta-lactamase superfamily II)
VTRLRLDRWRCVAVAVGVAGLLAVGGVRAQAPSPASSPLPLPVTQVAPGVYLHLGQTQEWSPANGGDVANLGFVVGERCVAVVDTGGTPQLGQRLRAAVAAATPLPVCWVINTHSHPDHILGNSAFATPSPESRSPASPPPPSSAASATASPASPAAASAGTAARPRFVASHRLAAALGARQAHYLNALQRDFGITMAPGDMVYPEDAVDGSLELDLGGRTLELRSWPTAHTDHDLTVYDRSSRTLFLSDLLFVGHMPVLDGNLRGWLAVMAQLKDMDVALAVPGHGAASTAWPGVMSAQQAYLEQLLRETRAAIKGNMTIQQAVDSIAPPPPRAGWLLADLFHRRNVTAAYAELEWED